MTQQFDKIGLGGGCHWCTEAIFQALRGVDHAAQGWASAEAPDNALSEAVLVTFDPGAISLATLVEVHLHTHSCTSTHVLRSKYRSAIYTTDGTASDPPTRVAAETLDRACGNPSQAAVCRRALSAVAKGFSRPIVTRVLTLASFELNEPRYRDYYQSRPEAPFCKAYIHPKLMQIRQQFSRYVR